MAEPKTIKVKYPTNRVYSKEGETERFYGVDFTHVVKGEGADAVHSLEADVAPDEIKSLLDAKIVVKA